MTPNLKAFLDMIAHSEGTSAIPNSDNGYKVIVGGTLFDSYKDHPRKRVFIKRINDYSSAAGRYQLLARYFDAYKKQLKLPDFSPTSQDAIAMQQIKECGAIDDINEGRFFNAVGKCCRIWASLPGNSYKQHMNDINDLAKYYVSYGGVIS